MQEAAALNRVDCIHTLLDYDADANVANDQGVTPLHEVRVVWLLLFARYIVETDSDHNTNL
jgi:hypothetical protein